MAISKPAFKLIGIVLMIIAIGLGIWGYQISGSFGSQLTSAFSGSDDVMTLYISGTISFVIGLYLYIKK